MRSKPRIEKFRTPPSDSIIEEGFPKINYCDSFSLEIPDKTDITNDEIINHVFEYPGWIKALFIIRHILVRPFGLKTEIKSRKKLNHYDVGKRVKFFKVISRNDQELVVGDSDKHLQARFSVMQVAEGVFTKFYLTTIVNYHNMGGRLYFIPVKPFHVLIVKRMIQKLHKVLKNENE